MTITLILCGMVAACDAATSGDVDFFASALDLGFIRLISQGR